MGHYTEEDVESFKLQYPKLYKVLIDNNTQELETHLKAIALYIMAYECLSDYLEDLLQGFFINNISIGENGRLLYHHDDAFSCKKVTFKENYIKLAHRILGIKKSIKDANLLNAACAFLHEIKAINDEDFKLIHEITVTRNDLTHEMAKWLISDKHRILSREEVLQPLDMYKKISNWWIINFEASINPEAYEQFTDKDMKFAISMQAHMIHLMIDRALPKHQ